VSRAAKYKTKRYLAMRDGTTFVQAYRSPQPNTANDHEPRRECSTYAHTCRDCKTEIRGMEPCWKARVNDRSRYWHLPCLPDAMAP